MAAMAGRMGPPRRRAAARAAERGLVKGDADSDAWSRLAERVDLHNAGELEERSAILAGAPMNAWAEPTARSNTQVLKQMFILHHTDFQVRYVKRKKNPLLSKKNAIMLFKQSFEITTIYATNMWINRNEFKLTSPRLQLNVLANPLKFTALYSLFSTLICMHLSRILTIERCCLL